MIKLHQLLLGLSLEAFCLSGMAQGINVDFQNVGLNVFVDAVSRSTHTQIIHQPLKGVVSLNAQDLSREQYLDMMRVILRANGYGVKEVGDILTIVEEKDSNGVFPQDQKMSAAGNKITRTMQLKNLPVSEVIAQLNTLSKGKSSATLSGLTSGNVLLLSGYADEVEKLQALAEMLDNEQARRSEVIPLKNASAQDAAKTLSDVVVNGNFAHGSLKPGVTADGRTNSLIINGDAEARDRLGRIIAHLDESQSAAGSEGVVYLRYTKSDVVEKALNKLVQAKDPRFSNISLVSVPDINAIVVSAAKERKDDIIELIHQLDVRRAQVHVEAMIVEVADSEGINFGVQWGDSKGSLMQFTNGSQIPLGVLQGAMQQAKPQPGSTVVSDNGSTTNNPETTGDLSTLMALMSGYNGAALSIVKGNWMALVQAMKGSSHANILSTPSLTTLDNQSASFLVGENVPILTGSTASADNKTPFQTVERRDIGTKLTILPQINDGKVVQLKISAEVSKIEGNTGLDVTFAERRLDTSVLVSDGSMIVLGGLIDTQKDESDYKVPVLGDIPVIGHLFSSHARKEQKRNLMIFLRPTIIRDGIASDAVTRKKYGFIEDFEHDADSADAKIGGGRREMPEITAFRNMTLKN
ncbi:secretin N-terminal domain-containing protein [Enterobacter kobei]|uniref:secretin N-terminal domain-containing protein n=1 Tax=Enterobacter kobei TaxID=208224 RepID=UPI003CF5E176